MNVYDFDGTIYDGDSSVDFYMFCLRHHVRSLKCIPRQMRGFLRYARHKIDKTELKEAFFCFLEDVPDVENDVERFWNVNERKIKEWYLNRKMPDDVVISASPEFLLKPICNRLGVENLIASKVDPHIGQFLSANCRGEEKVLRFRKKFPDGKIDEFYSDSNSDHYLAELSTKAYFIKNGHAICWNFDKH